tara:strand:+ start:6028 stop:7647 length:1620 start_codon:yes stop_codon:yes gene_type:complete
MPRNRTIYQSEALFAGQKSSDSIIDVHAKSDIKQLHRVQSANYAFNVARTDVNQFGELAAIDRVVLDTPTVSLDFSYLLANFANEENLGFNINANSVTVAACKSAITGLLGKTTDEKNYFIQTSVEGEDAIGDTAGQGTAEAVAVIDRANTIGIGNGFMTSYSSEASVGGFPTVSVGVEGMNMVFDGGTTDIQNPAINKTDGTATTTLCSLPTVSGSAGAEDLSESGLLNISTLRPGDIKISIAEHSIDGTFGSTDYSLPGATLPQADGTSTNSANIQSYNISFDLGRTPIQRLGNRFAFAREIDFPVNVSLSVDAILTDLTTGNLNTLIDCEKSYDVKIDLLGITGSACPPLKTTICTYILKDVRPDSQSYTSTIGDNKSVTIDFTSQMGGPNQTDVGLFMRGISQANTLDTAPPTFTMQHASTDTPLGFVAGDIIFIFDNAVSDAGTELETADFVLKTGLAGATPPVTVPTSKYDLVENVADKKYVLRPTQLMLNDMIDGEATTLISGYVPATTQDAGGNAIGIYRSGFVASEHFTG